MRREVKNSSVHKNRFSYYPERTLSDDNASIAFAFRSDRPAVLLDSLKNTFEAGRRTPASRWWQPDANDPTDPDLTARQPEKIECFLAFPEILP
jgi:hypothetical protein